ncbi:uncharacterized protein KGF55_000667 [Candida pseudojiufengensis]|uniref:uncharacterized protein n=1 Tax=Candida pseudojiufengensis TaxID=497109 RepID=UPI0022241934|nr:uncharacterized protein KGF55_000667 [Candida pseudojiufengensis]KAI5966358.1 hypothetical protein KGF55_000667 [Candida pseudojiufengensis]
MIRGNWSLAQEFKQNERKQQLKVQKRQKHQHKLEKLKNIDPIKLFHRIENLRNKSSKTDNDIEYLSKLEEDWSFIEKNDLHSNKVKEILRDQQKKLKLKQKEETTLWGKDSIYFNPELNPLGKVPQVESLGFKLSQPLKNLKINQLKKVKKYEYDPLIEKLGVRLPDGQPPKFYKYVQNTKKPSKRNQKSMQDELKLNTDNSLEIEGNTEEPFYKKQKG